MIDVRIGDLFASNAQTLVNTVNCVGVMGKGVALEFKNRFSDMYEDYAARCAAGKVRLGEPYLFRRLLPPNILNFPTKDHWRSVSRLSDIVAGLEYLERHCRDWEIMSLAVPPLGCGNGGLEWRVVGPTLYRHLRRLDIPVFLYAPHGTPPEELKADFLAQTELFAEPSGISSPERLRINPAWVALVEILARIEREPYHWAVGRTTFQKIAYFATSLGLPTNLRYKRGSYGPFAAEMKPLLTQLVNNGLVREEPMGNMLAIWTGPTYRDAARLFRNEIAGWEPIIDSVADLFLRMQTRQAEVAATVHFSAEELKQETVDPVSESAIFHAVKDWKQKRRPAIDDGEIARAIRNLNLLRWITAKPSSDLPLHDDSDLLTV